MARLDAGECVNAAAALLLIRTHWWLAEQVKPLDEAERSSLDNVLPHRAIMMARGIGFEVRAMPLAPRCH